MNTGFITCNNCTEVSGDISPCPDHGQTRGAFVYAQGPTAVTTKRWRGTYVARITPGANTAFNREWAEYEDVKGTGGPGHRVYRLEPGYYELREGHKGNPKRYLAITPWGERVYLDDVPTDVIVRMSGGPLYGDDGSRGHDNCECGRPVEVFDGDGFPFCNTHAPTITPVPDTLPDTI